MTYINKKKLAVLSVVSMAAVGLHAVETGDMVNRILDNIVVT